MYYPLSGYKIDGYDLYGYWKITVKRITGMDAFLTRKGDVSQSWPDSDGEEAFTNATDIWFEGTDIIMFCYITADTFAELRSLLALFKHRLELSGLRLLRTPYLSITTSVMYIKGGDVEMLTPKSTANKYVGEFWVQFRKPTPVRS